MQYCKGFLQKLYQAKEKVFILALTEWMDAVIIPIYKVPKDTGAVLKFEEDGAESASVYVSALHPCWHFFAAGLEIRYLRSQRYAQSVHPLRWRRYGVVLGYK